MRTATTLALAAAGILATASPCVAQSGAVSIAPKSSSAISKNALSPRRLSPPEAPVAHSADEDKSAREDVAPVAVSPQPLAPPKPVTTRRVTPDAMAPSQPAPQQAYAQPTLSPPAGAAASQPGSSSGFTSAERLLDWVSNYRDHPEFWKVPAAVHAMRDYG
ncbi:MAG TPA: hypothetical protein VMW05_02305, partial [Methyloceanibacter sp.]|nr:hypothetical protein [Methyloceanibacter sp.]